MRTKHKKLSPLFQNYLYLLLLPGFIILGSIGYGLASRPSDVDVPGADINKADFIASEDSAESFETLLDKAINLILQGKFSQGGKLIEASLSGADYTSTFHHLSEIVYEYKALSAKRESERQKAYEKKLSVLDEYRDEWKSIDSNELDDITKTLSLINTAINLADENQKQELFNRPFVKKIILESKNKAAEFEKKGQWLDAYIHCYSWLKSIFSGNEEYEEHAQVLEEKAQIVASLQDSPCESRKERYSKIKPTMFLRAVDALNFHYVDLIDYQEMAEAGVERCIMLAKVMKSLKEDAEKNENSAVPKNETDEEEEIKEIQVQVSQLPFWDAALSKLLEEINNSAGFSKDNFVDVFNKVLDKNDQTVELSSPLVIHHFAEAAFSVLDPYTVMVWPKQVKDFEKTMTNEFSGIGIEITKEKGLLTVSSLLPDTPAYVSGLDAGDIILEVDGAPTKDMSLICAVQRITGPEDTEVVLTVRSPGLEKEKQIPIMRKKITVPAIRGWKRSPEGRWIYMLDRQNRLAYIRITSFSAKTSSDLEQVLEELEGEGMNGLVLDLRFNSGGLLDSAVDIVDKFVEEGVIVKTQPRFVPSYSMAHKKNTHPDYPLVVLINQFSASASEIVSGALQDEKYNRAVIVGERSLGKGSVQGITPYPGGGAQLKYTMAYYHLPSGQKVKSKNEMKEQNSSDWGITPDVEVELRYDELSEMREFQRENDVLVKADHDNGTQPLSKHSLQETLDSDPQLAIGLLVLKTKVIQKNEQNRKQKAA